MTKIKDNYQVTLTQDGWTGIACIAEKLNLSVSELLERVGSGELTIVDPEDLEDYLDLQDALEAEADPENQQRIPWEQVKQELGL
ncbi:hypothetical protein [Argonema galeatum]|uniref:hypothetical protein n=1 Tax=Argonema galeatum TaxID=2942762 RepID=UPI0020139915|nr:hypothetical protein [Argonema galeatum]MCL1463983.1 hypothetical protein [Argonema galeatum A003/A1]